MSTQASMRTEAVLAEVAVERTRQLAKHGDQSDLPDGTGPARRLFDNSYRFDMLAGDALEYADARSRSAGDGTIRFADILLEEVFEALAEDDQRALRAELVQVAAVAVQWVEAIDARGGAR